MQFTSSASRPVSTGAFGGGVIFNSLFDPFEFFLWPNEDIDLKTLATKNDNILEWKLRVSISKGP